MRWLVCDAEVFQEDFIFVGINFHTRETIKIANRYSELQELMEDKENIFIGFNIKGYDQFIMKAIYNQYYPEEIKKVNDYIISGNRGYDIRFANRIDFNICDLCDDMQIGTSLKSIEGHIGMDIEETQVDFNLNRKLTAEELEKSIQYCLFDVLATCKVVELRMAYLQTKINLGAKIGLSEAKSLSLTNAKLTSLYLGAKKTIDFDDEREYVFPENLLTQYVPNDVMNFFKRIHDSSISDNELFESSLELNLGGCTTKCAWGGLHGAIPKCVLEANDGYIIENYDVGSYYPNIILNFGYVSRNIENPNKYREVVTDRLAAKKAGDKQTANDLKLIVNTKYGAMLNQYNDLYDPLNARSVCITGQLFLMELSNHYLTDIPNMQIVQINTDGVMIRYPAEYKEKVNEINNEWQKRTNFTLEEDDIVKVVQKDVNNYLMITEDGHLKTKGAYFKNGINTIGAFSVNNNMTIIADCLLNYFTKGIAPEETIAACNDPMKYQLIAKASGKYSKVYTLMESGEDVELQRCNRVYAAKSHKYGTLYKVKKGNEQISKIAGLPDYCYIDNRATMTEESLPDLVDKQWYIDVANSRINDFLGEREDNKMAEKSLNVYQKLLKARAEFLKVNVEKSGKNMALAFKYFELSDIIPPVTQIFDKLGLVAVVNFTNEEATMHVVNTDVPTEMIEFKSPIRFVDSNKGTNPLMALGSSHTYLRRYLYMNALDIVEHDTIDGGDAPAVAPVKEEPKPVAKVEKKVEPKVETPVEEPKKVASKVAIREEIKENLTKVNDNADELQLQALKNTCVKYITACNGSKESQELVKKIAVKTKGLTEISKADCEKIINQLVEKTKAVENELPF